MKRLKARSAAIALSLLVCAAPTMAGVTGTIAVTPTPIAVESAPGVFNATYSAGPALFNVNYVVDVKNVRKNTANDVVFTATLEVSDPAEAAQLISAPLGCNISMAAGSNVISITCPLGQMKAGSPTITLPFQFRTPFQVGDAGDKLIFKTVTFYSEGATDVPTQFPNSKTVANAPDVVLGTAISSNVRSALLKQETAQSFATAPNGTSTEDQIKTTVTVPSVATVTKTIDIQESALSKTDKNCVNFSRCYSSAIFMPDYTTELGKFIDINLNVGALKNNTNPTLVKVVYDDELLSVCQPDGSGGYSNPLPCLDGTPTLPGDGTVLIKIKNNKNGIIRVF